MSKRRFHLRVENPCPANWDAMEPREQGRFCSECQEVVVDLTAVTQCEAERIVAAATQKLCIRMRVDSFGRPKFLDKSRMQSALAAASLALAACGGNTPETEVAPETQGTPETMGQVVAAPIYAPPTTPTESCSSNCDGDEVVPENGRIMMGEAPAIETPVPVAAPPAEPPPASTSHSSRMGRVQVSPPSEEATIQGRMPLPERPEK